MITDHHGSRTNGPTDTDQRVNGSMYQRMNGPMDQRANRSMDQLISGSRSTNQRITYQRISLINGSTNIKHKDQRRIDGSTDNNNNNNNRSTVEDGT